MDRGSGEPVAWRSSIPGVSQREGAPPSLRLVGRGVHAPSLGESGVPMRGDDGGAPIALAGDSRSGVRRPVLPWRAIGLAVVALVAIVGVARAAGVDAGVAAGTAGSGWETLGALDGSIPVAAEGSAPGSADRPAEMPEPVASSFPKSPSQEAQQRADDLAPGGDGAAAPGDSAPAAESLSDESPDWWTVLAELDALRVRTLTEVDPALLSTYAQAGSTAWTGDAALLADLAGRGLRPQGLASRVLAVERVDDEGAGAQLQVVDERTGYSLVDPDGVVVQQVEPAGPRRWLITLSRKAPTATGRDPADAGESPGASTPVEGSIPASHSPGRDPGWRVAAVVPVGAGESAHIDEGEVASSGAEDPTSAGAP